MDDGSAANAAMAEFWNGEAGRKWVRFQTMMDESLTPLGQRAMAAGGFGGGDRVLDVGCGCGGSTFQLGARVGSSGSVVGIDISAPMLERARARAAETAVANVEFEHADAEIHPLPEGRFDGLFSRFGVMFFGDPVAAFSNLRAALRPGGRLAFVCWQPLPVNPWVSIPLGIVARHVELPAPSGPEEPGEFAFADAERVRRILGEAGFVAVEIEKFDTEISVAGRVSLDESIAFLLQMGPAARALVDAGGGDALNAKVAAELAEALRPHDTPDRGLVLGAGTWIVSARRA